VAPGLDVTGPLDSFPTWFWDFDNDGRLDIFVSGYSGTVADLAAAALGRPSEAERPRLYRNTGDGFEDVAPRLGLDRPVLPMGANFGDLDNDGFLDVYLGTGWPDYEELMPSVMYLSERAMRFAEPRLGAAPILISASATPEEVAKVQSEFGRERAGEAAEQALAMVATALRAKGARRFVTAGGETSGAVVSALGVQGLRIGPTIDPGVPWTTSLDDEPIAIALKSGNFGEVDFFTKAFRCLDELPSAA